MTPIGETIYLQSKGGGSRIVIGHVNCERCEKIIDLLEVVESSKAQRKMGHYYQQYSVCEFCGLYQRGEVKILTN